jgi:hypothetical protein
LSEDLAEPARNTWSFQSPVRAALPVIRQPGLAANPVDLFVLEKLEGAGLALNTRADRRTLLRRVSFDLTGLPPDRSLQAEFLADDSPAAYERLVERLLASPAFGERWARHWLDVVRYADTDGFKSDDLRPNAYRYRDYVIQSFNGDRPYDEFVRQQIAGDELDPWNPDAIVATGFNRLYPTENNAANLIQRRQEILDDVTEVVGLTFFGLTFGCARCHDHKFDAVSQKDYYRLQAFFVGLVERDDLPLVTKEEIERHDTEYAKWDEATRPIRVVIDELVAEKRAAHVQDRLAKFRPAIQKCFLTGEAARTPFEEQVACLVELQTRPPAAEHFAKSLSESDRALYEDHKKKLSTFDGLRPAPLAKAMAVSELKTPPPTHLLEGGNFRKPREKVEPRFPTLLGGSTPQIVASDSSSGRRAAFARWLTRSDHPLTARVIVNRLWQYHIGRGIVPTPSDFGVQGGSPTHPELLDWLAVELVESGWSLKHIHRLIVTSSTYCQSSRIDLESEGHARAWKTDRDNDLLWHARRRRLEGEAIRDTLLSVASELNRQLLGPAVRPSLPKGTSQRYRWKPDPEEPKRQRRSIYVLAKRNLRLPVLETFDSPDSNQSCARRDSTVTPTQALTMLNSELTLGLASNWAQKLTSEFGDNTEALVVDAYLAAFGRHPQTEELRLALDFLDVRKSAADKKIVVAGVGDPRPGANDNERSTEHTPANTPENNVIDFCHALLNTNEFIYVD